MVKRNKMPIRSKDPKKIMKKVMHEFEAGELNIGKSKKKVASRKQAIAIGLSVARQKAKNTSNSPKKKSDGNSPASSKKWIQAAISPSKKGSLRRSLKVKKGQDIPLTKLEGAAKKKGITGKRARLAMTLRKISKKRSK